MIQDTSLAAWEIAQTKINENQSKVYQALRFFPDATNAEIAEYIKFPVNRVTPRMLELRAKGIVFDAGKRKCKVTGGMAHAWRAKHPIVGAAFAPKKPELKPLF